jgi:hypothetical protein
MACGDVATAKAKAATAINLIISFSLVLALMTNVSSANFEPRGPLIQGMQRGRCRPSPVASISCAEVFASLKSANLNVQTPQSTGW